MGLAPARPNYTLTFHFIHTQTKGDQNFDAQGFDDSVQKDTQQPNRKRPNYDQTPPSKQPKLNLEKALVPPGGSLERKGLKSVSGGGTLMRSLSDPVKGVDESYQHPNSESATRQLGFGKVSSQSLFLKGHPEVLLHSVLAWEWEGGSPGDIPTLHCVCLDKVRRSSDSASTGPRGQEVR